MSQLLSSIALAVRGRGGTGGAIQSPAYVALLILLSMSMSITLQRYVDHTPTAAADSL